MFEAMKRIDFRGSRLTRLLFALRGMAIRGPLTVEGLLRFGFVLLDEDPGTELVLGVTGRFWRPNGAIRRIGADEFADFSEPGYVKAAWNFHVESVGANRSVVSTETRIIATDATALRWFRPYWMLVLPFSGLIRRRMLALIRTASEAGG